MQHRDDIDGLRALAVLPIVLFHAGVSALSGGFVGVDVFFVISGFLITTIILREMEDGRFSVADFYHRRLVRIFPALIVLLASVLFMGAMFLLAEELRELGNSAAAAMGFVSNLYFWFTADYFAGAAESKPLLHTWSLGVEEQFYLFYPIGLILLRRFAPNRIGIGVLIATIASFALSLFFTLTAPTTAFYLLPTRAWELGAGALVALGMMPRLASATARNLAATAGLALIVAGIVIIRATDLFPAPWALLPCVGAVLLIAYGRDAVTATVLGWRLMRWVGAVSYSLYLWHWPIITFYRLRYGMALTPGATVLLVALSLAAAALSYYLVEQPFLRRYRRAPVRPVLVTGAAALAGVVGVSLLVGTQAAAIVQHPAEVRRVAAYANYRALPQYAYQFRRGPCFIGEGQVFDEASCLRIKADRANVVVLGDSHAAQYWRALALRFPETNVMQATASGCRPTIDVKGAERCRGVVDLVLKQVVDRPGVTGIVLGGRWQPAEVPKLVETVHMLRAKGLAVTVIGPTVEYDGEMPQLLARAMLQQAVHGIARQRLRDREALDRAMRPLIERAGAVYLSEVDVECPGGECRVFDAEGGPFHFDYGHVTLAASRQIVATLKSIDGFRSPAGH